MYIHNIIFWLSKFLRCVPKNDKEYLEQLGKNIKAKRKKLKMSQADLAYKVGMDVPNLSVIENGKSNPQILTLAKLAAAMDAQVCAVLPEIEKPAQFLEEPAVYAPRKH
jgi:transcriptional regulator with XRE-family HTH domain